VTVAIEKGLQEYGRLAELSGSGRGPPRAPPADAVVPEQTADDDGEVRRQRAVAAELPEHRVLPFHELETDHRGEILGVGVADAVPPA
jgi:hypothetical protein